MDWIITIAACRGGLAAKPQQRFDLRQSLPRLRLTDDVYDAMQPINQICGEVGVHRQQLGYRVQAHPLVELNHEVLLAHEPLEIAERHAACYVGTARVNNTRAVVLQISVLSPESPLERY
jgi:hypothetical protein